MQSTCQYGTQDIVPHAWTLSLTPWTLHMRLLSFPIPVSVSISPYLSISLPMHGALYLQTEAADGAALCSLATPSRYPDLGNLELWLSPTGPKGLWGFNTKRIYSSLCTLPDTPQMRQYSWH